MTGFSMAQAESIPKDQKGRWGEQAGADKGRPTHPIRSPRSRKLAAPHPQEKDGDPISGHS
jgi:hypothetical protein